VELPEGWSEKKFDEEQVLFKEGNIRCSILGDVIYIPARMYRASDVIIIANWVANKCSEPHSS
jgi:hypothetical protein